MSINSKRKGKVGELELALFLRENGWPEAYRSQQFKGGNDSPDVCGIPGIHIECKRVETLRLYQALSQAQRDAGDSGNVPVVVHRPSRREWVVCLSLRDFLDLLKKAGYGPDMEFVA